MNYRYYAKSNPVQSIKEHTDKLLYNLEILKAEYGNRISQVVNMPSERFWELLKVVCQYHDVGKVFSGFQNEIRKDIGEKLIATKYNNKDIRHEQLSPTFIPYENYSMTNAERKLVVQSVFFHHERNEFLDISTERLQEILENDIMPNYESIKTELNISLPEKLNTRYLNLVNNRTRIVAGDELYNDYCLMKGLLHRLDHCSSADVKIEDDTKEEILDFVEKFMESKNYTLNDLQKYAKENQNKNLIVVASTGMGKTEAALLWSKADKTFFTLPLRISINAIYERIEDLIGYKHTGLLHSTASEFISQRETEELEKIKQSRNLYEKLTTCTIDQIFPFVFKYKGYEKIYATLSYSKIIIDEIQAYSPEIVAVILKGLQMINNLGGKFMIMTATLPGIYREKLEQMGVEFQYNEFKKESNRHVVKVESKLLNDDIEEIKENAKSKKILVIVNTINKALEIYSQLKAIDAENINLLHSRFIQEDRLEKEKSIKVFSNQEDEKGIWITTQIVEASIDIDFDMLYTEMSTLDSLFQRMGRCYRNRSYHDNSANIKVYTKESSGVKYVYDEEIHNKSIDMLQSFDSTLITEDDKIRLVDELYSKETLQGTKFYDTFLKAFRYLDNITDYDNTKAEAQQILRKIESVNVIPKSIYEENLELFEAYEQQKNLKEKYELKRKIDKLFIAISLGSLKSKKLESYITLCPYINDKNKYIIDTKYNKEIGLLLEADEEYAINSREL